MKVVDIPLSSSSSPTALITSMKMENFLVCVKYVKIFSRFIFNNPSVGKTKPLEATMGDISTLNPFTVHIWPEVSNLVRNSPRFNFSLNR